MLLFQAYGAPEEISTDGGPQSISTWFQGFLKDWCLRHCLSSAYYPQSNGWAELGVKTSKGILNNINPDRTIDNDQVACTLLKYCNTPFAYIHLIPAQILFHCKGCNSMSSTTLLTPQKLSYFSCPKETGIFQKRWSVGDWVKCDHLWYRKNLIQTLAHNEKNSGGAATQTIPN